MIGSIFEINFLGPPILACHLFIIGEFHNRSEKPMQRVQNEFVHAQAVVCDILKATADLVRLGTMSTGGVSQIPRS